MQTLTGKVALVAGQQSYAITFSPAFPTLPTAFEPTVAMPNDSGEVFFATIDYSTLSINGVTVWLNGVPSAASAGGYILWKATGASPVVDYVPETGIKVVELCNRIGRRARGGDFTKLSMNEQVDIMEAANAALQRLYNVLPNYFKEQTQGFVLPAPVALVGVGVVQYSKEVTGVTFQDDQIGQTVVLDGDSGWNQILDTNLLLNPYMGPTGTVGGVIYGNAIHTDTYPLDRIVGNPQFANQNLFPVASFVIAAGNGFGASPWLWQQQVGLPNVWWTQTFGTSQGKKPVVCLRFAPAPDQAYAVNVKIGFWPKRLTLADYDNNTTVPVPDQFIEKSLLPMCIEEFMSSPAWQGKNDEAQVTARGQAGERFAKLQLGQIGAPSNRIMTPLGF